MTGKFTIRVNDSAARAKFEQVTDLIKFRAQQAALMAGGAVLERGLKVTLGAQGKTPAAMVTISRGPRKGERSKRWLGPSPGGPGGPPGIFTGATRASVSRSRVRRSGDGFEISVGPHTIYSRRLDAQHPFMERTFERYGDDARTAYVGVLERLLP